MATKTKKKATAKASMGSTKARGAPVKAGRSSYGGRTSVKGLGRTALSVGLEGAASYKKGGEASQAFHFGEGVGQLQRIGGKGKPQGQGGGVGDITTQINYGGGQAGGAQGQGQGNANKGGRGAGSQGGGGGAGGDVAQYMPGGLGQRTNQVVKQPMTNALGGIGKAPAKQTTPGYAPPAETKPPVAKKQTAPVVKAPVKQRAPVVKPQIVQPVSVNVVKEVPRAALTPKVSAPSPSPINTRTEGTAIRTQPLTPAAPKTTAATAAAKGATSSSRERDIITRAAAAPAPKAAAPAAAPKAAAPRETAASAASKGATSSSRERQIVTKSAPAKAAPTRATAPKERPNTGGKAARGR